MDKQFARLALCAYIPIALLTTAHTIRCWMLYGPGVGALTATTAIASFVFLAFAVRAYVVD